MPGTVCVTGATGFIGSHLTRLLLSEGYNVNGTVRDVAKAGAGFLSDLGGFDRLSLYAADLLDAGSFDKAVSGCEVVFHVASPLLVNTTDPQRELLEPAVSGTRAVLGAAARAKTVRRVVMTSSLAAMANRAAGTIITDKSWNEDATLETDAYAYSKTVAEKAAWEFVDRADPGFDLVTINPSIVWGPALGPRLCESTAIIRDLYAGVYPVVVNLSLPIVDVRDLAYIELAAALTPQAAGRYIASAGFTRASEIVAHARAIHDHKKLPKLHLEHPVWNALARLVTYRQPRGTGRIIRANLGKRAECDTSRALTDLGARYRPIEETIADTIRDQVARGHIAG